MEEIKITKVIVWGGYDFLIAAIHPNGYCTASDAKDLVKIAKENNYTFANAIVTDDGRLVVDEDVKREHYEEYKAKLNNQKWSKVFPR